MIYYLVYSTFPEVAESEQKYLKFPSDIEDAKSLGAVLSRLYIFILHNFDWRLQVMAGTCVVIPNN